jgi:hypothetical protein
LPAELLLPLLDALLVPPSATGPPPVLPDDDDPPDEAPGPRLLVLSEGGVVADVPQASAHTTDSEMVRMCGLR